MINIIIITFTIITKTITAIINSNNENNIKNNSS